ncbi:MAG: tetratricopeptide repeat protein [Bacteroidota bacterium]|nr:tetratricopeptide repeat protein [Bacteroidota bacterium]
MYPSSRSKAHGLVRLVAILAFVPFALYLTGCGGSEEATTEGTPADTTNTTPAVDTTTMAAKETTTVAPAVPSPEVATLQQENEQLKANNAQLQQQLDSSEQTNKDLMAKISDLEAAQIAAQQAAQAAEKPAPAKMTEARPGKSSPEEIEAYTSALQLAKQRKFQDAINQFQNLLDSGIKSDYADNCHYWIGLCYYSMKDFKTAIEHFKEVLKFKFSEKKDDAQFMLAQSYERMGNRMQAQAEYKRLIQQYPTSEYVKLAQAKVR